MPISVNILKKLLLRTVLSLASASPLMATAQAADIAPIALAASAGQADKVTALLAQGVNPDARHANGRTALMIAAAAGHYETVRRLLIGGAIKNLKDNDGKTALDLAIENKHVDLVALMQEAS